jgi:hypothetical protein
MRTQYDILRKNTEQSNKQLCKNLQKKSFVDVMKDAIDPLISEINYPPTSKEIHQMCQKWTSKGQPLDVLTEVRFNFIYDIATRGNELKVFNVSDGLAKYLDLTDYKDIPGNMFRLPFENIMFKIPQGIICHVGDDNIPYDYTEIYVSQYPEVSLYVTDEYLKTGEKSSNIRDGRLFKIWMVGAGNPSDPLIMLKNQWFPIIDSINIKEFQDNDVMKSIAFKNSIEWNMLHDDNEQRATDISLDNFKLMNNAWTYVVKIILYINSQRAEMEKTSSMKRSPLDKNSVLHREEYIVGKNIIIDKRITLAYADNIASGRKMECPKWLVRGHLRRYNEDKTTWIQPYYKGEFRNDESIIEVNKDYIVKGKINV